MVAIIVWTHRVLLAELLGDALRRMREHRVVKVARSPREVLTAARRGDVLVVLDPGHPTQDVFATARAVRRANPRARLVFLADSAAAGWIGSALALGACAILGRWADFSDLRRALRAAARGQSYFSPCVAHVVARFASPAPRRPILTPREIEIMRLICEGRSSKEIGRVLRLAPKTIDAHRTRLIAKTGVRTATGLVRHACNERYVRLTPMDEPEGAPA